MYNGEILITFRALTHAQRGARLLARYGCPSEPVRPPQELASGQCAYALRIREEFLPSAAARLAAEGLLEGKIWRRRGERYEVVSI